VAGHSVLFISHEFPPDGGGAGRNLSLLAEALRELGIGIRFCIGQGRARAAAAGEYGLVDASVHWVECGRKKRFETRLVNHLKFIVNGWRVMNRAALDPLPDAVCANMAWPAGFLARMLCKKHGLPLLVWHHGSDVHGGRTEGAGWLQRVYLRWLWSRCRQTLFVSPSLRATAKGYGGLGRDSILPSMIDPRLRAMADAPLFSGEAPSEPLQLLLLGRLEKVKNPASVLRAMAFLRAWNCRAILRVVGQGSLEESLRRECRILGLEDRVSFEPEVSYEDIPALFARAYALLLPSRAEGMSLTLMEAALFGVPAIAAAAPGLQEFIVSGENGLLFQPDEPEDLARQARFLLAHPRQRDDYGRRAREWAQARTPGASAQAFLSALHWTSPVAETEAA